MMRFHKIDKYYFNLFLLTPIKLFDLHQLHLFLGNLNLQIVHKEQKLQQKMFSGYLLTFYGHKIKKRFK